MDNKTTPWLLVGALSLCLLVCVCGAVLGGIYLWQSIQEPSGVDISVDSPIQAALGEPVVITATISNPSDSSLEINSIDIAQSFLDGVLVTRVDPPYESSEVYDFVGYPFTSYYFYTNIQPGETQVITLYGEAIREGDFSGDLDVCIDSASNCRSFALRTVIR